MELLGELMREWYVLLSQVSVALSVPVKQMADGLQLPILAVLLIGLVGALSPCQLTTNLSAMAYVSRRAGEGQVWSEALAYTIGKVLIYTLAGGAVILLGLKLQQSAIPIAVITQKIVGPLMILIGFGMLGLIRLRGSFGRRLSCWCEARLPKRGLIGAFSLGAAFSFTFCPTLFWLFFGLMIPLALISIGGWTFPGLFALGTVLPLLVFSALLASGSDLSGKLTDGLRRYQRRISQVSGAVFILAGINDTLTYWFI
ncbi:MAG: sulfite exporter TauE/SafE family protein [Gammaproteobacteria bacterium]